MGAICRIDVVAVLALLSVGGTLGLSAHDPARFHFQKVSCETNLQQLGRATLVYSIDNFDQLPGCQHSPPSWVVGLEPYCDPTAYRCPLDFDNASTSSFALNDFLTPRPLGSRKLDYSKFSRIPEPHATFEFGEMSSSTRTLKLDHFHFAEGRENGFTWQRFQQQVSVDKHRGSANYLFADGHVEGKQSRQVQSCLSSAGFFVHPEGASGTACSLKADGLIVFR